MSEFHHDELLTLHHGDCVVVMATFDADSVDAIVTDPPYGLEFMGKEWDRIQPEKGWRRRVKDESDDPGKDWGVFNRTSARSPHLYVAGRSMQAWHETWAREAFRVAKPGAHLLAFGGTRTYHRLASAIEDAGWEIRDCLIWAYASGFPKSLDVSKAIDKAAGAEREVVGTKAGPGTGAGLLEQRASSFLPGDVDLTAPATDDARRWQGWGTALKPAWEPIVMARKPLRGTVATNVLTYGTGALNIDGTRIGTPPPSVPQPDFTKVNGRATHLDANARNGEMSEAAGRWPANLILTDPIFDGGVDGVVGGGPASNGSGWAGAKPSETDLFTGVGGTAQENYGDTGTYSRFFLIPKAARSDREPVLRGQLEEGDGNKWNAGGIGERRRQAGQNRRENLHPTVKPVELMRHLVRLVTPPGGVVLDCFLGSGTTAIAAELEGFAWIGIEKEAEYVAIAEARLNGTQRGFGI